MFDVFKGLFTTPSKRQCSNPPSVSTACGHALVLVNNAMGGVGTLVGCCELIFQTHVLSYSVTFQEFSKYRIIMTNKLNSDSMTTLFGGDLPDVVQTLQGYGPFI